MASPPPIRILLVDDSIVFRRFLHHSLADHPSIEIIGEAANGIEGLEKFLKTDPDLLLLDMEMPLMDGMTTLQHIMIHRPKPVIMFSSLSDFGSPRCFDTLKNGAVEFLAKDFIFKQENQEMQKQVLLEKVMRASEMSLPSREPVEGLSLAVEEPEAIEARVISCEECGARQMLELGEDTAVNAVVCKNCGDLIQLSGFFPAREHRNPSKLKLFLGGSGSLYNLLHIIPELGPECAAILVVVDGQKPYLKRFCEYLDAVSAINVKRAEENVGVEAGNCYLLSSCEGYHLERHPNQILFCKDRERGMTRERLARSIQSAATVFSKECEGYVLSGTRLGSIQLWHQYLEAAGRLSLLSPRECLLPELGKEIAAALDPAEHLSAKHIIARINGG